MLHRLKNYLEFSRVFPCGQPNRPGDTKHNSFVSTDFRIQVHHKTILREHVICFHFIGLRNLIKENVCHHTKKFTKTGLDPFIKYLIFAAAKASYIVLIRISMIPRIIVLFHRSPLSMVTPAKISNETMFILYFFLYGEHIKVFRKFSWRFLKRRFYQFRNGVLLLSKILQNKFFLKD